MKKKNLLGSLASALFVLAAIFLPVETMLADNAATVSDPMIGYSAFIDKGNATSTFETSNLWILIAAFLVFIMHLGFSTLESGLTQSKNTTNILFKNVFIISIGVLTYAVWGFNAMYPGEMIVDGKGDWNGWFAMGSWFGGGVLDSAESIKANFTADYAGYTWWTDFIFQAMFAATGATIVSGAVAERI